jgi:SAM-dependent methyltransferase
MTSPSARGGVERPFYGRYAEAYDRLIADPVGPWVEAVHSRLSGPGELLDAGCGTGRQAAALVAHGHRVDLADGSAALLAQAAVRCPAGRRFLVDLCAMELPVDYDAVTCRGVLNDMTTDAERAGAVASLAGCLRPGGLLFLDVREAGGSRRRADGVLREKTVEGLTFASRTTWDQGLLRVDETYTAGGRTDSYRFAMRPWTAAELESAFGRNGLRVTEMREGVGRRTPDRLFVVAARD